MSTKKIKVKGRTIKDIDIALKEVKAGKGEPIERVAKEFRVKL